MSRKVTSSFKQCFIWQMKLYLTKSFQNQTANLLLKLDFINILAKYKNSFPYHTHHKKGSLYHQYLATTSSFLIACCNCSFHLSYLLIVCYIIPWHLITHAHFKLIRPTKIYKRSTQSSIHWLIKTIYAKLIYKILSKIFIRIFNIGYP